MEIAIIGAGHNGLVCANYLASAGHKVTVFERNEKVGGLCLTTEHFPGFRVSTVAGHYGYLRGEVIRGLKLESLLDLVKVPTVQNITLLPEGKYIVGRLGEADEFGFELEDEQKDGWNKFWNQINVSGAAIGEYLTRIGVTQYELQKVLESKGFIELGSRLFDGTLLDIIDSYFDNPALRAAACASSYELPTRKGTIFGCVYSATAAAKGIANAHGVIEGGMGVIVDALYEKAGERGCRQNKRGG